MDLSQLFGVNQTVRCRVLQLIEVSVRHLAHPTLREWSVTCNQLIQGSLVLGGGFMLDTIQSCSFVS